MKPSNKVRGDVDRKIEKHQPQVPAAWLPADFEIADAAAIQALARGDASADQQQRALKWIVEKAALTYDLPFRPGGVEGARDTDFACGRAYVGQQVRKLLILNLRVMQQQEQRNAGRSAAEQG